MTNDDISALKATIVTIGNFVEVVDESLAPESAGGKKVTWPEGVKIAMKAVPFIGVFKNAEEMVNEFQDMDDDERAELVEAFAQEFNLRNEEAEQTIEEIFDWVIQGIQVVSNWKASKKEV
jgi:hypothetical protein